MKKIEAFIAKDSILQSQRVSSAIFAATIPLENFPEIGAFMAEGTTKRFREIHVFKYRIIYRYYKKTNEIRILAVVHAARQLSRKFFRELE